MVKDWLPIVTPPTLLMVRLPKLGAAVNKSLGSVKLLALAPITKLLPAVTVNVPAVLTIGVALF